MSHSIEICDFLIDIAEIDCESKIRLWEPSRPVVVLGRSNNHERECNVLLCKEDGIPVIKRKGGGGAVLLTKGMLIFTLSSPYSFEMHISTIFQKINGWICSVLKSLGIENLKQQGISDITIGNRKILGCSLYRRKNYFLYQGSLLVNLDILQIIKYLKYPSREPEYRNGRLHEKFLTSLSEEGHFFSISNLKEVFYAQINRLKPLPTIQKET